MTEQCAPCTIKYDYITQLETIDSDVAKIASRIGLSADAKLPQMNKKAGLVYTDQNQRLARIYAEQEITLELVDLLHEYYKHKNTLETLVTNFFVLDLRFWNCFYLLDFELFGYDFQKFRTEFIRLSK